MTDILDRITAYKREEIAAAKKTRPLAEIEAKARAAGPCRSFSQAIRNRIGAGQPALIAEIKRASPSKGLIRADFDPPALARAYEAGGAACLSVLTDGPSFQGVPEHLIAARAATQLPVLRKDFMLDPYQIAESRGLGADCILIIMACLDDAQVGTLAKAAGDWGMDALFEVHDESEVERALRLGAVLIGINNRDLKTFETSLETTERLSKRIADPCICISESGIFSRADIDRLSRSRVHAFLVGESLMRQADVAAATRTLLGTQRTEAAQ